MKAEPKHSGFGKLVAKTLGPEKKGRRREMSAKKLSQLNAGEIAFFLCMNGWDVTISHPSEKTLERRQRERVARLRREKKEAARG